MRPAVSRRLGPVMLRAAMTSPCAPRTGAAIAASPGSSSSIAAALTVLLDEPAALECRDQARRRALRDAARLGEIAQRDGLLRLEHADEQIGAAVDGRGSVARQGGAGAAAGRLSLELLFHAGYD